MTFSFRLFIVVIPALIALLLLADIWLDIPVWNFKEKLLQTLAIAVALFLLIGFHGKLSAWQRNQSVHFASFTTAGLLALLTAFHIWFGLPVSDATTKLDHTGQLLSGVMIGLFALNSSRKFWRDLGIG